MTRQIEAPNTHKVLDAPYVEGVVRQYYRPQLEVLDEVIMYGANLLLRCLDSEPLTPPNITILNVLFRHVLASLDGCRLCLVAGNVYAANQHGRALLDGSFQIGWIFHAGEKEWGNRLFVHSWRQNRLWALRIIPGTKEYEANAGFRGLVGESASSADPAIIERAKEEVKNIDELLGSPDFREANQEFEAFYQAKRREVDQWFKGKKGGPQSIRDLAKATGNDTEYGTLFKFGSGHTHGGYAMNHASFWGGGIAMEPIRTVEGFNQIFTTVVHVTLGIYMKLIQRFRSGEEKQFRATYAQQWRDRIRNLPELQIESDYK